MNKNGILDLYEDFRVPVDQRVEDILSQMTLKEKAGMMFHPFLYSEEIVGLFIQNKVVRKIFLSYSNPYDVLLTKEIRHITSALGADDPAVHAAWQNMIQELAEQSRLGIPVTVSSDPRHSDKSGAAIKMDAFSKWPDPLGFAAIGDSIMALHFGRIAAQEYRAVGIHTALHPMADLATEPRWARISGTFGEDADMSSMLTAAYIKGFQGDSITCKSVSCMTKHFSGGGPQEDGWDAHFKYGKNQVYPGNNFDYHLIPFKAALEAGTIQIMPYYGIPVGQTGEDVGFAFNKEVITDLLRDELGFEGIVCSDWGIITPTRFLGIKMGSPMDHGVEDLEPVEKVKKALDAGIDQFGGEQMPEYIIQLVEEGEITKERIDYSVRKLLKLKFDLGLFDNSYVDEEAAREICNSDDFREAGKTAMHKSMVLLTNKKSGEKPILPLSPGVKMYTINIDSAVTSGFSEVVNQIEEADAVILKLNTYYESRKGLIENIFHQGSLAFPADTLQEILSVIHSKPTIVCLYLDRPAVIPEIAESASALIGHFGSSDEAILDLIFGKVEPYGKLPFEMPSSMHAVEEQMEDVPYDSRDPLFPYGYGLRYQTEEE
ncbi:MAG: beta-glucosidase [Bacteroides sp. SM23_62_1]|nr:MAG: beta-glucosidase [Bacteroides sp. SM23_62_1]